jgi:hypothetical protein
MRAPINRAACESNVAMFEAKLAARPLPIKEGALLLSNPACDQGCSICSMACAIVPERLKWWREELSRSVVAGAFPIAEQSAAERLEAMLSAVDSIAASDAWAEAFHEARELLDQPEQISLAAKAAARRFVLLMGDA